MIGVAMFTTIKTLWEKHKNKSAIAELTGHDWKTVSKVVKLIESGAGYPEKKPHSRILDPHKENICLLYTSPSPRDRTRSRMPSSA